MLASRVLPPILHRSSQDQLHPHPPSEPISVPPVATFFNIPRRYVRSNMQVGDLASSTHDSPMEDVKSLSPRSLRKNSRFHELRSSSTSNSPVERTSNDAFADSSPTATRKRFASYEEDQNGNDSAEGESPTDLRPPGSATSTGSGELSGHVCLCQPEPKIPRPRNAFILYRQHHQHAIVARKPGLANPEISKIIGEQWKAEGDESKKVWQDLAQEEKLRHHEQYPDYRYQPRRLGKPGSLLLNTQGHTTVDKYRCPRCNGRSIKTPTSPFLNTPTLPPPNESSGLTPTTRYLPMMPNLSLDSPAARRGPRGAGHGHGPSSLSHIQVSSANREDAAMYSASPLTPGSKKRRYDYPPFISNGRRLDTSYYSAHNRRDSLPPIHMGRSPPGTATLPPVPRTPRADLRRGSVDLNLLVPSQHDQSRSVEAMVMSVPYNVKIKVLGRITPPLKDPGPTSPAVSIRGGIVAVEGDDLAAVKELTEWLRDFLAKDKEYLPRIEEPPRAPSEDAAEVTFEEYLDLVKEWHGRSKDMVKFITTPITPPSSTTSTDTDSTTSSEKDKDSSSSPKDKDGDEEMSNTPPPPASPVTAPKPVIILPTYQLHASDAYASKIPIQDVYSPMDHWQWMATLWRGTVGPDLTIYVKSESKEGSDKGGGKVVEVNDEGKFLTVVRGMDGKFAEKTLRRVGFEVGEWIRGLGRGA